MILHELNFRLTRGIKFLYKLYRKYENIIIWTSHRCIFPYLRVWYTAPYSIIGNINCKYTYFRFFDERVSAVFPHVWISSQIKVLRALKRRGKKKKANFWSICVCIYLYIHDVRAFTILYSSHTFKCRRIIIRPPIPGPYRVFYSPFEFYPVQKAGLYHDPTDVHVLPAASHKLRLTPSWTAHTYTHMYI